MFTREGLEQPSSHGFMDREAWFEFHCELYDVVSELAVSVERIEAGMVRLADGRSLELLAVMEQCDGRPREDWHGLVHRHLQTWLDLSPMTPVAWSDRPSKFDLRVRLVPFSPIDERILSLVGARRVTGDIAAVLSLATRHGIETITPAELDRFGWDEDTSWRRGWEQTELLAEPDELDVVEVGGIEIVHLFGRGELTATLAFGLEEHIGPIGDRGAIVGLPCDHSVLIHPIEGSHSRHAIGTMAPLVRKLHADGPGSLSPQLYWWRDDEITWIPTIVGDVNEVYLPEGLGDVLG
ncbi:MAG: hypothetical protein AAFP84_11380 [Actinomycetota bacterium]